MSNRKMSIQNNSSNVAFFRKPIFWLWMIFILVLAFRLYIVFQTELFNYDAYFSLRQIEHIKSTGMPLYHDSLSYGGKTQLFAPLYYYVLAGVSFILPVSLGAKIIPNIFAALLVIVVYYLTLKITKSIKISLTTSFMSGFIPIYFMDINRVSSNYFSILIMFSIIYCMFRVGERRYIDYALILMFLLVLTTPMAFVLVLGLLIYLLLLKLENMEIQMKELEIILFFTFLVFWVNLLIYKNALLNQGLLVIWQNIPIKILSNFFGDIGFLEIILTVGIVPLIFGTYAFYNTLQKGSTKEAILLIGFGTASFMLLWFKLIDLVSGIMLVSITLTILTAYALKNSSEFIDNSKIIKYKNFLYTIFIILFIFTGMYFSAVFGVNRTKDTPQYEDIDALVWAKENLPKSAVIVSRLEEGNLVAYYANRKNVMDTNFLLTPRIDKRFSELEEIYTTSFETRAITNMNNYNANYLLLTPSTLKQYDADKIPYLKESVCFELEFQRKNTYIYRTECKVE